MIEPSTIQIEGRTFTLAPLPGRRGLHMLRRLGAALGPALGAAAGMLKPGADTAKFDLADLDLSRAGPTLERVASLLFEKLTEAELNALLDGLLDGCEVTIGGNTGRLMPMFDTVFQGKTDEAIRLLGWAIRVNFGSFLPALFAAGAGVRAAAARTNGASLPSSPRPSETPGLSGAL